MIHDYRSMRPRVIDAEITPGLFQAIHVYLGGRLEVYFEGKSKPGESNETRIDNDLGHS